MEAVKYIIFFIVISGTLLFGLCAAVMYHWTSDCPFRFRFEMETNCWVKDEQEGYQIIELFNVDSNGLWLAEVNGSQELWLQHPDGIVKNYKSHIPSNIIKYKNKDRKVLSVNGEDFEVVYLSSRPDGRKD